MILRIGDKIKFIKITHNYHIGDIMEIASVKPLEEGDRCLFRCHGVSGFIWGYSKERLAELRVSYPKGNFGFIEKDLSDIKLIIEEWDI